MRKSADNGYAEAQYNMGQAYYDGVVVDKNMQKGFEWFKNSAENGYKNAQYNMGVIYDKGYVVDVDKEKAAYRY